jgi:MFS family permease
VTRDALREEELESSWEAGATIAIVIGGQLLLAILSHTQHWRLWHFPWWAWLIPIGPEILVFVALAWHRPRRRLEQLGYRREVALVLLALISFVNALLLLAVLASLVRGDEKSGSQLLLKAATVWGTNVLTYGLWYWELDRGGPVRRFEADRPPPDFQFPQMENPQLAEPRWAPHLLDYIYVSYTNSIAFSPTDAMPLTRRAKMMMLSESTVSSVTVLLVAARAVNIFK